MFKHINKPGKQVFTTECTGAQNNFRGETLSRSAHIHTSAALSLMSTNGLATAGQLANCMIRERIWDVWNYLLNAYSLSNEPQAHRFSQTLYCARLMIQHTHGHILSLLTSNSAERNAPWVRSDDDVLCVSFFVVLALFLLPVSWLRLSCRVLCCTLLAGI